MIFFIINNVHESQNSQCVTNLNICIKMAKIAICKKIKNCKLADMYKTISFISVHELK